MIFIHPDTDEARERLDIGKYARKIRCLRIGPIRAVVLGASLVFSPFAVMAAPPGSAAASSSSTSFTGTVETECSLDTDVTGTGTYEDDDTVDTSVTYATMDSLESGAPATTEDRVTAIIASDSAVFDCNTDTVKVEITESSITTPVDTAFTNATDLNDIEHVVSAKYIDPKGPTDIATASLTYDNTDTYAETGVATGDDGDIKVEVDSVFQVTTAGSAEELPAGSYGADLVITVTAE